MKTRENRGEKPRHRKIRTTQSSGAKFAQHHPLVWILFCGQFSKSMLSIPSKISVRKCTRMQTLCEFSFVTNFQKKHALCLGEPQECEIFALPITMCEIRTFSLKAIYSSSNSKLVLLQFSQHLSSDHPCPSTGSSPSSSPILNPTMAANLKSFTP